MKCVIACGGTGGHLAPGIALAEVIQEEGGTATLAISQKRVDARLLEAYPHLDFVQVAGAPFSLSPRRFIRFCVQQSIAFVQALNLLREQKPDVVLGFGGFNTMGLALAAFFLNIPLALHEANRRVGKAVRHLSALADLVFVPHGVRLRSVLPKAVRYCGYPIRRSIRPVAQVRARAQLGLRVEGPLLLVLGGSQGAASLNEWVRDAFPALAKEGINVCCVTGLDKGAEGVIEERSEDGKVVKAFYMPFCDKMAELLCSADIAVARAGAGTLAEFVRCRVPAMLVPLPSAADNHQEANARWLEGQGGAILIRQSEMEGLTREVIELSANDELRQNMKRNLERLDRYEALETMLEELRALVQETRGRQMETAEVL